MNLFDKLVEEALKNQPDLSLLKIVVEKELLHHDILRIMRDHGFMSHLTFMGGTCLRCCYGGVRLSEDLDFTGGQNFSKESLLSIGQALVQSLENKYDLKVSVSTPVKDSTNTNTWKIKIETRPESKSLPAQRINLDVCALPSYEKVPMVLLNPYGVDMGTSGLIIQAQSREEIYVDKLIAFALRPNRVKYRDLWDIMWLHGQGLKPRLELIPYKLRDRNYTREDFLNLFDRRVGLLSERREMAAEFKKELQRFLPAEQASKVLEQENLWSFIINLMTEFGQRV